MHDTSGTLDEALERLHRSGPERRGHAAAVHRWLDRYRHQLEELPTASSRITEANWRAALGDPRQLADWIAYFARIPATPGWLASAVVTAAYAPAEPLPGPAAVPPTAEEAFERAATHGDEHVIKFADTALDVAAADPERAYRSFASMTRACELIGR